MANRITPWVLILLAFGAGPAWAQGFRSGSAHMPVRAPVLASQGFAAFNGFGSAAVATQSFGRTPYSNFNTNHYDVASPAGSFAINSKNAYHPWTGTYTSKVRETERTPYGTAMLTTREAYNPGTGAFGYQTRESFVPSGFSSAFASPWTSSFSAYHNPWQQLMNPYGMNGYGMSASTMTPYGMSSYAMTPYGMNSNGVNPYAAVYANWNGGGMTNPNMWAATGFNASPYVNPYPYSVEP
jgi:hypothetical protein